MITLRPMLATLADTPPPLQNALFVYEPKYDGIRALVQLTPKAGGAGVEIHSRLGNDKTAQFPDLVDAFRTFARALDRPVLLDGEIVALDAAGRPAGFQKLQGRIHLGPLNQRGAGPRAEVSMPVAFYAFDVITDGGDDLRRLPLADRRVRLERLFQSHAAPLIHLTESVAGDGRTLLERARREGLEGLVVKHARSVYQDGRRSRDWQKLKLLKRQEFVVGGWTEGRGARSGLGALLLGVYENQGLRHVGQSGSGFSDAELRRVTALLKAVETDETPFIETPKTMERAHWVKPNYVVEIEFTEWTDEGRLRHPIYLGLRDDKKPTDVHREEPTRPEEPAAKVKRGFADARPARPAAAAEAAPARSATIKTIKTSRKAAAAKPARRSARPSARPPRSALTAAQVETLIHQLDDQQRRRGRGRLTLPDGSSIEIGNLEKVFWPEGKRTKGDLLRYYARIAPYLLPAVADRPLVMKRFPNGIEGQAFYQQRAPDDPPPGARIETVSDADEPDTPRVIGGSLTTLLWITQLAAISQDPWFSRIQSPLVADYVAIDLDPMPEVKFSAILDVARWVHEELTRLKVPSVPKTSGSRGLHIYIPLPPDTSYDSGLLLCQIVATIVAGKHRKIATVERMVKARGKTVYIDYLQNIVGKTLATAYSARASPYAGVSAPLTWNEVHAGVDPRDYTIETMPARVAEVGDLWAPLRESKPVNLHDVLAALG